VILQQLKKRREWYAAPAAETALMGMLELKPVAGSELSLVVPVLGGAAWPGLNQAMAVVLWPCFPYQLGNQGSA
jgi:hypothetical protein